jgi:aryl-alcohol dehydrogenase (NADP+)
MAAWQFSKALHLAGERGWHRFVSMQNHYNLVYREEEREMIPLCVDQGVGLIPWSPLARGFLGGSRTREDHEATPRARTDKYGKGLYFRENDFQILDALLEVAAARGVKPAQAALAWILQAPGVTAPIIGTTKVEHLHDATAALEIHLDAEEVAKLEAPYEPHQILGHAQPTAQSVLESRS